MKKRSKFIHEFKVFISRGNVMDLAVGLIIGSAFTAIVKSLVDDVIMPLIGLILGGINFSSLRVVLREATEQSKELALSYGKFIQSIVDFLLIAFVVFLLIKTLNSFRERLEHLKKGEVVEEVASVEPSVEVRLLTEIRDLLKK